MNYLLLEYQMRKGRRGSSITYAIAVSFTSKVVSSNPAHGEVYSIQHYVIKFLSDFRQGASWSYSSWFLTACAISAFHHKCCDFEPRSDEVYSIQHYVIKFVSDLRLVGGFFHQSNWPPGYTTEILLKVPLNATIITPNTHVYFVGILLCVVV